MLGFHGSESGKPGNSTTKINKSILLLWAQVLTHSTAILCCATGLLRTREMGNGTWRGFPGEDGEELWAVGCGCQALLSSSNTHREGSRPLPAFSALRWLKITAGSSLWLALTLLKIWNLNHSGVILHTFFRCSQWACCWFLSPTSCPWSMAYIKVSCI